MDRKGMNYFEALFEVARVVNASLEPSRVLEEIVRCVVKTMRVKACSLRLLDARRKRLLMGASYGLSKPYIRKGTVLVSESGIDRKALKGETVWLKDAQTDKDFQYREEAKAEGIKSVLVVPLKSGKRIIGVFRVYTERVRNFTKEEIRFLEAVAHLSAIAIENARLHQNVKNTCDLMFAHKYRLDDN